jgi:predicted amidohydrolase
MLGKEFQVALAQIACKREDKPANIKKIEERVTEATRLGARLVVFPELTLTGYVVKDQLYELAETIPGPSTKRLERITKKTQAYIVIGMPELEERTQSTMHNSAVLIGPDGIIGKYRKMYLPTHSVFEEKRYFRPGYQASVFRTELGTLGLIVCYDIFFPEVARLTRLSGAQLIICISASPAVRRSFFEILTAARAVENSAFLALVNLVGIEDGLQFWGGSRLIGPSGRILAKARYDDEDLVLGKVDFQDIRPVEAFVPTLKDLRPELFDKLKDAAEKI